MKNLFSQFVQALPHSFGFCLALTFLSFLLASLMTAHGPFEIIHFWGSGFWSLNNFAFQMMFILVGGHLIAVSPVMKNLFRRIASIVPSNHWAAYVICLFSCVACWLNWGLGLVASAFLAREIAQKNPNISYGALIGSAYSGFLVWHGGLSGSIPLKLVTPNGKLGALLGGISIPLSETIFSLGNLVMVFSMILLLPLAMMWLAKNESPTSNSPKVMSETIKTKPILTLGEKINCSGLPFRPIIILGAFYFYLHFEKGGQFDLNFVNFTLFILALIFHKNIASLTSSTKEAIQSSSGILLQFPFYAGIMAIISSSGLADQIGRWFINNSTAATFPFMTFLSAGLLNVFVPSGGGQWALQAPLIIPPAQELGLPLHKLAMAVAWGDAWTNMIQPFWAIPLLGIAGLELKDIAKYCLWAFLISGVIFSISLTL